jgi:CBS domain
VPEDRQCSPVPPVGFDLALMHSQPDPFPKTVLWSRGYGCAQLAELLATEAVVQVDGDPRRACLDHRADLLVMRKVGSFDLVPVAAPNSLDMDAVRTVVAAVGEGPHSELATVIAARIAKSLGVAAEAVSAVRPGTPREETRALVDRVTARAGIPGRLVETENAAGLIEHLEGGALLVLGAPGGSWFNRQFVGPGARLKAHAPGGTVVVRDAPRRAFQLMTDPEPLSVHMHAGDAAEIVRGRVLPVTDEGRLVGVVRAAAITSALPATPLGELMEDPPLIDVYEEVEGLAALVEFFEGDPLPLVDEAGTLRGMLDAGPASRDRPGR